MTVHSADRAKMTKHVGVCNSKRCVVVIQLPEDKSNVHIIDTDALPDQYHQTLMDVVESREGQAATWIGEVLHRRVLGDGTNALRTFYDRELIQEVPVNQVTMTPYPNHHVPLRELLGQVMDSLEETQSSPMSQQEKMYAEIAAQEQAKLEQSLADEDSARHNQHQENLAGDQSEANQKIAEGLLVEAEMLEAEAKRKRDQAAQYGVVVDAKKKSELDSNDFKVTQDGLFVDLETGRTYKTASALKGAVTKRKRAQEATQ